MPFRHSPPTEENTEYKKRGRNIRWGLESPPTEENTEYERRGRSVRIGDRNPRFYIPLLQNVREPNPQFRQLSRTAYSLTISPGSYPRRTSSPNKISSAASPTDVEVYPSGWTAITDMASLASLSFV